MLWITWLTTQEAVQEGVDEEIAQHITRQLQTELLPRVQAAISIRWQAKPGDWCLDLWRQDDQEIYDSVLRIVEFRVNEQVAIGV